MKHKLLRWLCCCLTACQLFSLTAMAKPDWPSDTGIAAEAGIVVDADSGAVLFAQNSHVPCPPASITKLLTALIVLENCEMDETVIYSDTALQSVESDSGNKLSLQSGDQLSVKDSLYALLLISVNQSANALAEHVAGSIPAFVDMMNAKIKELGCEESHFDNPSGLNGDTQYVSAHDMALIAQAAFDNEELLTISSTINYKIGPTIQFPEGQSIRNEHRLLYTTDTSSPYYYPSAVAGKTGYLIKAGNTLVTYAVEGNRHLISVILKGQPRQYFLDSKELLSFGFRSFQNVNIAEYEQRYVTGDEIIDLPGGSYQASSLSIDPDSVLTLPVNASFDDAELSLEALPDNAPDRAVALLRYTYNERIIGEAYLMTDHVPVKVNENPSDQPSESAPLSDIPEKDPSPTGQSGGSSLGTILLIILVSAILLLLGGGLGWIVYSRKKEAQEQALRKERRRKRLEEEGADAQAEFDRLMKERWKR